MSLDSAPVVDVDRIDAFHELLSSLAGALDIREALEGLCEIAGRIVPHDEAWLVLLNQETGGYERYASACMPGAPGLGDHKPPDGPKVPSLFLAERDRDRGFQAGLRVPVVIDGQPSGMLALLSRQSDAYSERELTLATRIVEYLAVVLSRDRLAEQVHRAALARDRSSNLESSVELLRTIAGVLDIRGVFPRVSEIVTKVLPHDHLQLVFRDQTGAVVLEAR